MSGIEAIGGALAAVAVVAFLFCVYTILSMGVGK